MPKTKRKRGQLTKCNHQLALKFDELLRTGLNIKDCCTVLNVNLQDYYNWKNRAKEALEKMNDTEYLSTANEKKYIFFFETVNKAEVYLKQEQLLKILKDKNPQNAQWWLSKKYKNEYGEQKTPVIDNSKTEIRNVLILNNLGEAIAKELNRRSTQEITDRSTVTITETD